MPLMRRQLLKLMLPTEQARTMMLQTAEALRRADAGDADAYALVRILTPLIKFRACRDARKVSADAMEVRGGCGYIEEWGDARRVRDAMLGSIWEGTSNIVALDVLRAIRRDDALSALTKHLRTLLAETPLHPQARRGVRAHAAAQWPNAPRRWPAAASVARRRRGSSASALYHSTTALAMAWEAGRTGSARRMHLAQCVLRQRVLPQDPLAIEDEPGWLSALLDEAGAGPQGGVEAVQLF